jgi:calcium-translocating P-type ATPase
MTNARSITPFLVDEPVRLGPTVTSAAALLEALGLESAAAPGLLPLGPGAVLLHARAGAGAHLALRWARLCEPRALAIAPAPVRTIVALIVPIDACAQALAVAARLVACFEDRGFVEAEPGATTREQLVRLMRRAEEHVADRALATDDVLALLGSGREGLAEAEAARRRAIAGPNRIERIGRRSIAVRLLEQFVSLFALLLWVAGALAFLAGMPQLGVAVFAVILVNGTFSFLQEYRAERAVEALERLLPVTIKLRREGRDRRIEVGELVPGDVVRVAEGDLVPADGQLLESEGLRVDQGALTGESRPLFKVPAVTRQPAPPVPQEHHELLFAGSSVVAGSGVLLVRATGMATEIGRIAGLTQAVSDEPSPLRHEMARLTRWVTTIALTFGAGFFAVGVISAVFPPGQGFFFALGVIVANVPEGLLPTLTLALAAGARRMAHRRVIVRRLSSVEGLGATTVICTDKTGTLTENRMDARHLWAGGVTFELDRSAADADPRVRAVLEAATLASLATPDHGDPTERALVSAAADSGVDAAALRSRHRLVAPFPFDSVRKRMTLVHEGVGGPVAWVKGAPRLLLERCASVAWDGAVRPLDEAARDAILAEHDRLAAAGHRMIAVASRALGARGGGEDAEAIERELTLLGLVALWDPPRPDVEAAIATCGRAGIRVIMVTGDDGITARAIASRIGLEVRTIVTGDEALRLTPDALRHLVRSPGVLFARATPAQKLSVVVALREQGEVVAVTGDGVNDAPALRAADVGVAMGQRGSDVAREAAAMVIADDHFATIVSGIRYGRSIEANIRKFVTYVFASNVPELVPFLVTVLFHVPLPLTVMQILAVDLGTDLLPALALGAERPEPGVMDRPPRPRGEPLLHRRRLVHAYGFLGVIEAVLALGGFFLVYVLDGWRPGQPMVASGPLYARATTMTFAGIVAAQIGNAFACRTERESVFRVGIASNRLLLWSIVAEIGVLLALVFTPPLASVFGFAPLRPLEWAVLLAYPPVVLAVEEARKARLRATGG